MEPGYGSPIGAHDTVVVVDELVARSPNLVAGANREGFHFRNVNVGRDFTADVVADITNAQEGDPCPTCGKPVILRNGIEVGNIFKLGTKFTDAVRRDVPRRGRRASTRSSWARTGSASGATSPASSRPTTTRRGSSGPRRSRRTPPTSCDRRAKEPRVTEVAERLHELADDAGREILYDDRDESPGVKFTDAELLGMPWILTVSPRSLAAGGVEVTERATGRALDAPDRGGRGADPRRGAAGDRPDGAGSARPADGRVRWRRCRPARCSRADDLYARLELPVDASPEAIEVAWRALLKRHHPDVAGAARRRRREADQRRPRLAVRPGAARALRPGAASAAGAADARPRPRPGRRPARGVARRGRRPVRRRPLDPAEAVERHLDRVRRLTDGRARPAVARRDRRRSRSSPRSRGSCRPDRWPPSRALERRVQDALPARGRWDAATRDAVVGYAHELLLGPFLDEHLSEPFRERVRERLARGWEAAIDQPRYGPNTAVVVGGDRAARGRVAGRASRLAVRRDPGGASRPTLRGRAASRPQDDDALRVSSALAQRDAAAALPDPVPAIARRSLGRAMHGLVLRHAFRPAELDRLLGPWAPSSRPALPPPRRLPPRQQWPVLPDLDISPGSGTRGTGRIRQAHALPRHGDRMLGGRLVSRTHPGGIRAR